MWRAHCTSREPNWAAGALLRGCALTCFPSPARLLPRQAWHFATRSLALCAGVLPHNWFAGYSIRSREPMPRYYFHYRDGSSIFEDDVGEVFADASLARQHARKIALELARGGEPTNAAILVIEGSQHLFEVPLSERGN